MKLEHLSAIRMTNEEMIEAMIDRLEMEMNDEVPTTEKYNRLDAIIRHLRDEDTYKEINMDDGDFILSAHGIALAEDF